MHEIFHQISNKIAQWVGSAWAFFVAFAVIVLWAISGPLFNYSDTWQLVINTSTTIVTFLMVFIIQNTQNRDSKAVHLKLDELIKGAKGARNILVDVEAMTDQELEILHDEYEALHYKAQALLDNRRNAPK